MKRSENPGFVVSGSIERYQWHEVGWWKYTRSVHKAKRHVSKRVLQENKAYQIFPLFVFRKIWSAFFFFFLYFFFYSRFCRITDEMFIRWIIKIHNTAYVFFSQGTHMETNTSLHRATCGIVVLGRSVIFCLHWKNPKGNNYFSILRNLSHESNKTSPVKDEVVFPE